MTGKLKSRTEEWDVHRGIWKYYHIPGSLEGHGLVQVCVHIQVKFWKGIKLSSLVALEELCKQEMKVKAWGKSSNFSDLTSGNHKGFTWQVSWGRAAILYQSWCTAIVLSFFKGVAIKASDYASWSCSSCICIPNPAFIFKSSCLKTWKGVFKYLYQGLLMVGGGGKHAFAERLSVHVRAFLQQFSRQFTILPCQELSWPGRQTAVLKQRQAVATQRCAHQKAHHKLAKARDKENLESSNSSLTRDPQISIRYQKVRQQ